MGFLRNTIDTLANRFGYTRLTADQLAPFEARSGIYEINQMLYDGLVYQTRQNGGALEDILKTYIGQAFCDPNKNRIYPFLSPFKSIVDAYQYVLPGTYGNDIRVADEVNGKPVNEKIIDPIGKIWRASNLDTSKATGIQWAANFGTTGIRVVAREAVNDKPARVALQFDHPSRLFNFELDDEGNATAVCLKYEMQVNRNTGPDGLANPKWETVKVVELLTKDDFSRKYDDEEQIEDADRGNTLGFCPYVILRHRDNGTKFGSYAYQGSESIVHRVNWRMARQDKSIDRHQFPNWFFTAGGDKPADPIDLGDSKAFYTQTIPGTPPPSAEAIVPKIDQKSTQDFWMQQIELLRHRQPEINLNDVKLLGNTSGEALSMVLKPTEKVIADARPGYHHAFIRALQMGLSAGVKLRAWDIGTGEDSEAAYRNGFEDFAFAPQPVLPPTDQQLLTKAQAETAEAKAKLSLAQAGKTIGFPRREQWRLAGKTDDKILNLELEAREESTLPGEDDVEEVVA